LDHGRENWESGEFWEGGKKNQRRSPIQKKIYSAHKLKKMHTAEGEHHAQKGKKE